jgi:hypothetical protein
MVACPYRSLSKPGAIYPFVLPLSSLSKVTVRSYATTFNRSPTTHWSVTRIATSSVEGFTKTSNH